MKRWFWVFGLMFACGKAEAPKEEAVPDAATEEAHSGVSKAELKELETEMEEVVKLKADPSKRRDQCLILEPKVAAKVSANPTDAKLQAYVAKLSPFCSEAMEGRRLMTKAAVPEAAVPELSASMKSSFTASMLKDDLATAKATVKKKGDASEVCKRIDLTARLIGEGKKKDKKTKKLLKEAPAFCAGPALTASIRSHLELAVKAEKEDQANTLSEHCTAALVKLQKMPAGKSRDSLDKSMVPLCREVYALKGMLVHEGS